MPIKIATKWEIAKPILEKDYLEGRITDDMRRGFVHKMRKEFEEVPINNFGNNWLRMKKSIGAAKSHAVRDRLALIHDRNLYPIDQEDRWDGSLAQSYLHQDLDNEFHLHFTPTELRLSRTEYQKFKLPKFTEHIHQYLRSKKETSYWMAKKAKKAAEKRKATTGTIDNVEFGVNDNDD